MINIIFRFIFILFFNVCLMMHIVYAENKIPNKQPEYFFIQIASHAQMRFDPSQNTYILKLYNIDDSIVSFSNIPHKITKIIPIDSYLHVFKEHQKQGVNAAFIANIIDEKTSKRVIYTFNLTHPQYDHSRSSIAYNIKFLHGIQPDPVKINIDFSEPALLIDGCASCGGN